MRRTLGILSITLAILLAYPFAYQRIPFFKENFTSFNLLNGLMDKKDVKKLVSAPFSIKTNDFFAFHDSESVEMPSSQLSESEETLIDSSQGEPNEIELNLPPSPPVDTSKIYTLLFRFFQSLEKAEKGEGQARIFYFGDSMIEGDLITQTIRDNLQKQFGGEGVGWVPVTSIVSGFRGTILHSFSKNIPYYSLIKGKSKLFPFGIQGEVFSIKNDTVTSWVKYSASKIYPKLSNFPSIRFFYHGNSSFSNSTIGVIKTKNESISLPNKNSLNSVWITKEPSKTLLTEFKIQAPIGGYGFSFESKNGVILDNFSLRGSNGSSLLQIPGKIIQEFNEELSPSLIVLQYGLNVAQKDRTNFENYRIQLEKVIKLFQKNCPQSSILVMGVGDKSRKIDGELQTDPCIPYLIEAQKRAAMNCGVAFFSLYDAMGGEGSMIRWVKEEKPALANLDYTHVNGRGAAKLGNIIHKFLINGYQDYKSGAK